MGTQIKYFKKVETSLRQELGVAKAKNLLSKAVYLIGIGGNDYLTKNSTIVSNEEFVSMVVGNLTLAVKVSFIVLKKKKKITMNLNLTIFLRFGFEYIFCPS